jgi:hypothetical protein
MVAGTFGTDGCNWVVFGRQLFKIFAKNRTCRIIRRQEARVPYLGSGGYPRGGVWLSRNLKGGGAH